MRGSYFVVTVHFIMADLGEGTYVCTLDKDTQKIAKKELFEDPKQRASQIETFREWVKSQPHFVNCRTGMMITSNWFQSKCSLYDLGWLSLEGWSSHNLICQLQNI